jgi:hypothetical protein
VLKAGVILLTGTQPPLLFEMAPVFFAVGLFGLHASIGRNGGLPAELGRALAGVSGVLAGVALVTELGAATSESYSPVIFGAFLANLAALILLGIAARRANVFGGPATSLPLAIGLSTLPLLAVGGALESISERLLELPVIVIGSAWIGTGYFLLASARGGALMKRALSGDRDGGDAGGTANKRATGLG